MADSIESLLSANERWARRVMADDPDHLPTLARGQSPKYLWIGCSDSRVPPTEILGLRSGDIFVHRNIANIAAADDLNLQSVLAFAVNALRVEHVIVCGHSDCGGVKASLSEEPHGLIDRWLEHLRGAYSRHEHLFREEMSAHERVELLTEVNVREQVKNVCNSPTVQSAWRSGRPLSVHGWFYTIATGRVRDLGSSAGL